MSDDDMDRWLNEWAAWFNSGGCTSGGGWPMTSVLHPSWMPPTPGQMPAGARVGHADHRERRMHAAIGMLGDKLIAAVVVRYCKRWSVSAQAEALGCTVPALHGRIARARARLAVLMVGAV